MKPVALVTGGAGYIGSHTCKLLAAAGYTPVSYDNLSRGSRWAVRWGPLVVGDLSDSARLDEVFTTYQPEVVVHFAAYAYVAESMADPEIYYRNNISGTLSLLSAMRRNGCHRMVFSSTCATYGKSLDGQAFSESSPQNPLSVYGRSKLMIEQILADYGSAYGLQSVSLRYFNAAGCDIDLEIGECHDPEPHVVPNILRVAAGSKPLFEINGASYPTPDGTCVRDYTHVCDLARAHVLAIKAMGQGGQPTRVYNLGNGRGYSILEIIKAAEGITGRKIPAVFREARPGDPPSAIADAALAHRELGWTPLHGDLDSIIGSAWAWMQKIEQSGTPESLI